MDDDRAAREAVTSGLTDQKTMNQLSSSGENAKDQRMEARAKREEAAGGEAQEQASGMLEKVVVVDKVEIDEGRGANTMIVDAISLYQSQQRYAPRE
jgi:hypothetical protein